MDIPSYDDPLKQIKTNLWILGIPYNDSKIYIRFYIIFVAIFVIEIEEIAFIISKISAEDLLVITQLAPCTCIGVLSVLKVMCLVAKRKKIFKLTLIMKNLYTDTIKDKGKRDVIRQNIIFVNILSKYFFILNVVLVSVYNFSTLIFILYDYVKLKKVIFYLPFEIIVPFEIDTWPVWFVVYIHSISSGYICVLFFTTIDILYYVLTTHICNNFAVISKELLEFHNGNIEKLKNIVKQHQHILQLSEELEDIFNLPNLFNVLVGSLEICVIGFNLTMGSWVQMPGCILFLVSVLLQILMMSVFGENLIRESNNIGDAVFSSDWYTLDTKTKKIILIIMTRAHKHQQLTAYKFSTISYGSFSKIISTSWSYFTILKAVYKPAENNSL